MWNCSKVSVSLCQIPTYHQNFCSGAQFPQYTTSRHKTTLQKLRKKSDSAFAFSLEFFSETVHKKSLELFLTVYFPGESPDFCP